MLIVQRVSVSWGKESRGAPASVGRNGLPRFFPLPDVSSAPAFLLHVVNLDEHDGFVSKERVEVMQSICPYWLVRFKQLARAIEVSFIFDSGLHGAPRRGRQSGPLFELQPGQWGRFEINGRFGYGGGWSYRHNIFNIAWAIKPERDVFLGDAPDFIVRELADLW
jgi:hypothetical protein